MEKGFPEELIDEIKAQNEITDVISQYISLKRIGSSNKALCPFHNEKTPSFNVSTEKQFYKCFGCGEGGDVIQFIMKMENLDFMEAIKMLAQRANIEIPEKDQSLEVAEEMKLRNLFWEINKKAAKYYYHCLTKEKSIALGYLSERGLISKTINTFGLGFAPNEWQGLIQHLTQEGYDLKDIEKCGLIIPKKEQSGYYDRFRNRIIFPIFDIRGNVVGFGGRVLDDSLPKYLNSPETKLFNKSRILYGLNIARKYMTTRQLILVEGYMDVIPLYQQGFKNVVAALGTSLTKEHAQVLKRYCDDVILCFDGDEAGIKATLRSIEILKNGDFNIKVMMMPKGVDPDTYIQSKGKEGFQRAINAALNVVDYQIMLAKEKYPQDKVEGRVNLARDIAKIIKQIKSPIEKEAYIQKVSQETGINQDAIALEVYGHQKKQKPNSETKKYSSNYNRNNNSKYKYIEALPPVEQKGHTIIEKQLIKFMLLNINAIPHLMEKVEAEDFTIGKHQLIVEYIYENHQNLQGTQQLVEHYPDLKETMTDLLHIEIQHIDMNKAIDQYLRNLKRYKLLYEIRQLQQREKDILNNSNLNKEEVEKELLEIGIEIMKKKLELQRIQA
ncbi:DNA primase [Alkaliphilus metalliredigens QYMF]|uniref:DNA primase n=1 Tax=Alkaliphilus metalliredigens (strain QYMF) TaxID=293826 RepID=A6TSH0_ALKMQ|nr:DNA primase [Alkaliphilus metalliredigens]ABR49138.1 DNA primase [Alkaliphilus metalliredigens QYMF]